MNESKFITPENITQKIEELQNLTKQLGEKSDNLVKYQLLKDMKMQKLHDKEEFLKAQENSCIQRFRELFENANMNILSSSEIIINDNNEIPHHLVHNISSIRDKINEQFNITERREKQLKIRERNINDFIDKLSVEEKERFRRLEQEQRKSSQFAEECMKRINEMPDYARIKQLNVSKQIDDLKQAFKDLKNVKVMKIIENVFSPKKQLIHSKNTQNLADSPRSKEQKLNYDNEENEIFSQQIVELKDELRNKRSLEHLAMAINNTMSKAGEKAYVKPTNTSSKFVNGQKLNKTFNLTAQPKKEMGKKNGTQEKGTGLNDSYKGSLTTSNQEMIRSSSMPTKNKNPGDTSRDNSYDRPRDTSGEAKPAMLNTAANFNLKVNRNAEMTDVEVDRVLGNHQIDNQDIDLLEPSIKSSLKMGALKKSGGNETTRDKTPESTRQDINSKTKSNTTPIKSVSGNKIAVVTVAKKTPTKELDKGKKTFGSKLFSEAANDKKKQPVTKK